MSEPIHSRDDTPADGELCLPVLVELVQYPPDLDNVTGDRFAHILSWVASACIIHHGPAVSTEPLGTLAARVEDLMEAGGPGAGFEEIRDNLIKAAGALVSMIRVYDDLAPLGPEEPNATTVEGTRVIDLTDPDTVLTWVRGAVARAAGIGVGIEAAHKIAPAAHLNRLGLSAPDYDELQSGIAMLWDVDIVIPTAARVQEVADKILAAVNRRSTASC